MYANPTLRSPILRALRNAVESKTQVQNQGEENESEKEESKKNLRYLRAHLRAPSAGSVHKPEGPLVYGQV